MNTRVRIEETLTAALKAGPIAAGVSDMADSDPTRTASDAAFQDRTNTDRLTRLIASCNASPARIIGITGDKTGAGASTTARQLASAYARFQKKVLLVAASRPEGPLSAGGAPAKPVPSLLECSLLVASGVSGVDLDAPPFSSSVPGKSLRALFDAAADDGHVVIVDLPPVMSGDDDSLAAFSARASACDLVFLVCVSGETTSKTLKHCVETCEVADVKLGGLILNDWKLPMSGLLES